MNDSSATVSFSIDRKLKNELDKIASLEGRSKSDTFRDIYRSHKLGRAFDAIQIDTRLIAYVFA